MLDLSGKIDPRLLEAVDAVSTVARRLSIPFLIVGAAARDFLLEHACGIRSGRATEDVDFAVRVRSWDEFETLVAGLEGSAGFVPDKVRRHRFQSPSSLLIDLVPFGPIAGPDLQIVWPPDHDRAMSVEGFESAMTHSVEVLLRTEPRLVVKSASLPGLALLKLLSWDHAYPERSKDGYDLWVIMNSYMEMANLDRLSTDARDLVTEPIPPLQEIGARLLGRDMASIADVSTSALVAGILHREEAEEGTMRLLTDMMGAVGASTGAAEVLSLLRAVERGFLEIHKST